MARILFPSRFADQVALVKKIRSKHVADGASSILTALFTENEIDINADSAAVTAADASHTFFSKHGKDAEKLFKERDRLFTPIFKEHRRMVQFLKGFYAKNIGKLGDWGVTVNGKKIVYPTDVLGKIVAVIAFIDKHQSYATGSPLEGFLADDLNADIDMAANETNSALAKTNHDNATQLNLDKETRRAERDALMVTPVADYIITGNFLMNHYSTNPNKAGDWGFTVDTSPQGSKVRNGFINIGSDKVLRKLAVGGLLINNSEFNIEIFKGTSPAGTPVTLAPGKPFLIITGFGTLTIRNPDDEKKAFYQGVFLP